MTINTLLFDLDNTLIKTSALMEGWAGTDDYARIFSDNFYQNADDAKRYHAFWHALKKSTGLNRLKSDYQSWLLANISPDKDQIDFLTKLKKHYKMALVSNGSVKNQMEKLRKAGLEACFQTVIISGKKGMRKPGARIFRTALHKLGSIAPECLFIGDSLENDVAGAAALGMKTCWVNRHALPQDYSQVPDYQITNIGELARILSEGALHQDAC